ncbi:TFIIH subunit Tfb4/p34 [Papiliotrema laurentii]|uniref:General transcription and DNA repair factor IIH subunit TFB4 n=1 Tax=Papiliotrema laurentii TaxID=5418 RepID=A0AAD9CXG9_PAPLA|nr:TFIIH subunit Tfb4/p34 [Papiliotrema laurentii]
MMMTRSRSFNRSYSLTSRSTALSLPTPAAAATTSGYRRADHSPTNPPTMAPPQSTLPFLPPAIPPSTLFLILDIHPLSWSLLASDPPPNDMEPGTTLAKAPPTALSISHFLDILLVFLNAHLASRWGNEVVVFAATAGRSSLLYPPPASTVDEAKPEPNMYHPFRLLDKRFEKELKSMVEDEQARLSHKGAASLNEQPAIVSALTKALCYINRVLPSANAAPGEGETQAGPDKVEPRILIINATPAPASTSTETTDISAQGGGGEMRGGYVGLMNCVFAAQKAKVPIDVLTLPPASGGSGPPIFLQQAAHLTDGVYWRWNGRGGLLQYLHSIFLAPPALRNKPFASPPQDAVDFRAVCFCHHNVVDVGFVCSVCLSSTSE